MSQETTEQTNSAVSNQQLAIIRPPRLPYHPAIEERFGVDRSGWKALVEAIFPLAKSPDAVIMALSYCKARRLDPFKRPVHIVPMWSAAAGEMVETVWPGISELRTTAFRTGQYSGMEAADFGPMITRVFEGTSQKGRTKGNTRKMEVTFPEWCQITIWRVLNGERIRFVSPKVYWLESYGKWTDTDVPNDMWGKRPVGQIEKCTEAAGLRRAFPEEIGNDYAAEEMEGQRLGFAAPAEKTREGNTLADRLKGNTPSATGFDPAFVAAETGPVIDHDPETGEVIEAETTDSIAATASPDNGAQADPEKPLQDVRSGSATDQAPQGDDDFPGDRPSTAATKASGRKFIKNLAE
jgi:phage recombination protein Bet